MHFRAIGVRLWTEKHSLAEPSTRRFDELSGMVAGDDREHVEPGSTPAG
jgi:hypothetical protein